MVEETVPQSKPRVKTARPKPVYLWTVVDVQKWFRRHCADYIIYSELFSKNSDSTILPDSIKKKKFRN